MGRRKIAVNQFASDALKVFGDQIRAKRMVRGWTQQTLAASIGVSRTTAAKLEAGAPEVSAGHYFAAAHAVGLPLFENVRAREMEDLRSESQVRQRLLPERVVVLPKGDDIDFDF